jgi:isohexenylglutaconyl-CoA hydratase
MKLPDCKELLLSEEAGVLTITLNRPHKRNAMNSASVDEILSVVEAVASERSIRALVFRGAAGNFCAGGDISGMKQESQKNGKDASWHFNRSFGRLISKVNRAPQVVVCVLEGAVLGGGFGLVCISDVAIAERNAMFAMPETGLGIIPAQIAPFVVARIGLTQTRRLALIGERINGEEAQRLGIVHHVVDGAASLNDRLAETLKLLKNCAPEATATTKNLILDTAIIDGLDALLDRASDDFAEAITSAEGQEGTRAFVEKRRPKWAL